MAQDMPIDRSALEASLAPPERARTLPAEAYVSPDVLAWEREALFDRSWICVGRSADLAGPGDRRAVSVGTDAVLLVRGKDERLRGFFNTCRHRGHELLPCNGPKTTDRWIRCPYHSWTYGLDGSFRAAPEFTDRDGWSKDDPDNSLVPARVEEWGGWTFVNVSGEADPLPDHVGNLDDALAQYELDRLVVAETHEYEIAANWKLIAENYHECYHCSTIHPELCRVTPPESGVSFDPTGLVIGGTMDLMDHAQTMSLSGESHGIRFRYLEPDMQRRILYVQLFPNMLISTHPDYVMTHRLEATSEGTTSIECQWLFPPEAVERESFDPAYAVEFWDITNRQDWSACEGVQRGASGRGYRQGPLSEAEGNVWQFITLMARSYLEGGVRGPVPTLSEAAAGGVD